MPRPEPLEFADADDDRSDRGPLPLWFVVGLLVYFVLSGWAFVWATWKAVPMLARFVWRAVG